MTATATQQVIHNGPRNLVLKYTIGGSTGDATSKQLLDLGALDPALGVGGLKFQKAQWAITGFSCKLQWDGGPDVDLIELNSGFGRLDFSDVGGIKNNATDQSGDVVFTTTGYTASGNGGHILLEFKKRARTGFAGAGLGGDIEVSTGSLTLAGQDADRTVA